jgi:hypothetical protein
VAQDTRGTTPTTNNNKGDDGILSLELGIDRDRVAAHEGLSTDQFPQSSEEADKVDALLAQELEQLSLNKVSAQGTVSTGEKYDSDRDCIGNLDCIRTGVWEQRCFPITCAKGAAKAMLDFGFDSQAYINKVINNTGFASKTDFVMMGDDNSTRDDLAAALAKDEPHMRVCNENLTACMNPKETRHRRLQGDLDAPLFSCFGKSTWATLDPCVFGGGLDCSDAQLHSFPIALGL